MKCFDNNDGRSFGKCCSVGDYEECWTGGRGNPNGAGWRMREFFFVLQMSQNLKSVIHVDTV